MLRGQDGVVEQARRQLEDLVPVWVVLDYTHSKIVERELLLAKVSILGPEHFHELIAHHREDMQSADQIDEPEISEKQEVIPTTDPARNPPSYIELDVDCVDRSNSRWTVSSAYSCPFGSITT